LRLNKMMSCTEHDAECSFVQKSDSPKGKMHLVRQKNYQFQGEIQVGNPPQPITACFDTGSANAWIMGKELHNKL
jgi:hypothetical protein